MAEQLCPVCGCYISVDAYEADGVIYCCEPCATGGVCECGCCVPAAKSKKETNRNKKK